MKKTVLLLVGVFSQLASSAQVLNDRKLSIEPAIGMRISSAFGLIDVQVAGLVNYSVHKHLNLASHTAISFDLNTFKAFKNIDVMRSVTTFQKFGLGPSFAIKGSKHAFLLMAGAKYFTYQAKLKNPKLEDNVDTRFNTWTFDKGLLYHLMIGRGNTFFSSRIYSPVLDGKWMMIENTNVEFGVGFKLR